MEVVNNYVDYICAADNIKSIKRLWNNKSYSKSVKTDKVEIIFDNIPLSYLRNIQIPLGNTVALLQDASILTEVQKFISEIPQCTHCWKLAHKYKKCEERNEQINNYRKTMEDKVKNDEIDEKQKEINIKEYHPKRYCKKCNKKGHRARDCKIQQLCCAICGGNHASIKSADCPAVRTLIKLYRNARMMQQDGFSLDKIKGHRNYTILQYEKNRVLPKQNNQQQQLHNLAHQYNPSEIDRGGNVNGDDNKKDDNEIKNNDDNDVNMNNGSQTPLTPVTDQDSFADKQGYHTADEINKLVTEVDKIGNDDNTNNMNNDDYDSDSNVLDRTVDGLQRSIKKRRLNKAGDGI